MPSQKNNIGQEGIRSILSRLIDCLMKPLDHFRETHERGEELFQYLFYDREKGRKSIQSYIDLMTNVTLIGNPGQGKSSLLHYMFIELKKSNKNVFPIILDWRKLGYKDEAILITNFVEQIRKYFSEINELCKKLEERTTVYNAFEHMRLVSQHLQDLRKDSLSKKLVILLDDLDYAGQKYYNILQKYFINYAYSDKAVMVLSCRRPLYNNISSDDQLRQCYRLQAKIVNLNDIDLESMITYRIRSVAKQTRNKDFQKRIAWFGRKKDIDSYIMKYLKLNGLSDEELTAIDTLPFNSAFYINLYTITHGNLRDVEQLIPIFCEYEEKGIEPHFNDDFIDAYMNALYLHCGAKRAIDDDSFRADFHILDLVTQKTDNTKKRLNGNAILQNVLEYFCYNEVKSDRFYESMSDYGISKPQSDSALETLITSPYSLLDPEFIYSIDNPHYLNERYILNNKAKIYVNEILRHPQYHIRMENFLSLIDSDKKQNADITKRSYLNEQRDRV